MSSYEDAANSIRSFFVSLVRAMGELDDLSWVEDPESVIRFAVDNELYEAADALKKEAKRRTSLCVDNSTSSDATGTDARTS